MVRMKVERVEVVMVQGVDVEGEGGGDDGDSESFESYDGKGEDEK
jgi:hypothetical protein